MRKTLFFILALFMITSVAYGLELTSLQTGQLAAIGKGRTRVSDTSVIMRVWYTGSSFGAVGVSANSALKLYMPYTTDTALYTIDTSAAAYDTVGEVVDYINSSATDFSAEVGQDGYRALDSSYLLVNAIAKGPNVRAKKDIILDCSTAGYLTCGAEIKPFAVPRLRQVSTKMMILGGIVTTQIYEGDVNVWREDVTVTEYNTATSVHASPNTVDFSLGGSTGGMAGTKNTPLVVKLTPSTNNLDECDATTEKLGAVNISILYDEFEGR